MPSDAILRSPTQTPGRSLVGAARLDPLDGERADDRRFHHAQELDDRTEPHYRVADELPGPVVGELAAAVDIDDLDPPRRVRIFGERQLPGSVRRPLV